MCLDRKSWQVSKTVPVKKYTPALKHLLTHGVIEEGKTFSFTRNRNACFYSQGKKKKIVCATSWKHLGEREQEVSTEVKITTCITWFWWECFWHIYRTCLSGGSGLDVCQVKKRISERPHFLERGSLTWRIQIVFLSIAN